VGDPIQNPIPVPASVAGWPGGERRSPKLSDPHYLVLAPLARQIEAAIGEALHGRTDARVLDIGCGGKPYLPFAAPFAASYCGIDSAPGPLVDVVAAAEELPFDDESFDLVLCTQVLEHVQDPGATIAEIRRVLAPGGTALVSTHGVFLYHPDPAGSDQDYWRWTHSGLRKAFGRAGDWARVGVDANGDVIACLAYVTAQFVDELGRRIGWSPLRRMLLSALNAAAERVDARFPPRVRFPAPGSLSANYLVTAVKS
jgi:SAM-dependent methyltransferase